MEVGCNTVDWAALLRHLRERPDEFLFEVEGLLEDSPIDPGPSAIFNHEATSVLEAAARALDASQAEDLDAVTRSFSAASGSGAHFDAELPKDDGIWYAAMSPETLKRLVARADRLDRGKLEPALASALASEKSSRIESARECLDYFDAWVETYRRAADEGRGVLVSIG